jgi:hypothetical protein
LVIEEEIMILEVLEEIMILEVFGYITGILSLLLGIILSIYKIIGKNKQSLENVKKRFEIYEKIIMNVDNKELSYTYLKDYLGCPISDDMIEYILKSTHFYDIVSIWKNIYTYIDYDPKAKMNKIRKLKVIRILFAICYFILILPFIAFLIFLSEQLIPSGSLIPLFMITVSSAIVAIFFFLFECGNITQAIRLMKKLEKEEK